MSVHCWGQLGDFTWWVRLPIGVRDRVIVLPSSPHLPPPLTLAPPIRRRLHSSSPRRPAFFLLCPLFLQLAMQPPLCSSLLLPTGLPSAVPAWVVELKGTTGNGGRGDPWPTADDGRNGKSSALGRCLLAQPPLHHHAPLLPWIPSFSPARARAAQGRLIRPDLGRWGLAPPFSPSRTLCPPLCSLLVVHAWAVDAARWCLDLGVHWWAMPSPLPSPLVILRNSFIDMCSVAVECVVILDVLGHMVVMYQPWISGSLLDA